ncbi:conserved hypothetical protein [delta proteobacterium NaphS2]|nr:conserved hypothetical protein [delta proteobacterium NaphS2]
MDEVKKKRRWIKVVKKCTCSAFISIWAYFVKPEQPGMA